MLRISINRGKGATEVLEFPDSGRVSFGRDPDNDIVLPASYVSRAHGYFVHDADGWHVVECGSKVGLTLTRDGRQVDVAKEAARQHGLAGGECVQILTTLMSIDIVVDAPQPDNQDPLSNIMAPIAFSQVMDVGNLQRKLKNESKKLELILELAKDLNRMNELDEVLRRIGHAVFEALRTATHFSVYVKSQGERFVPRFGALRGGAELDLDQVFVSRSILQLVLEREMAMVFHTSGDNAIPSTSMIIHNVASSMAVPLCGSKGVVGVMQIDNRATQQPFSQADLDLIIVLAHSAAFALERAQLQAQIHRMFEGFVDASVTAIECRDPTTSGHSRRVASFSVALAEAATRQTTGPLAPCAFTDDQLTELAYAALLHDFGKVGVPEQVLVKANRLYPEQLERVENRFSCIRLAHRSSLLRSYVKSGARNPGPETALRLIDQKSAQFDEGQRETLAFLRAVDTGGRLDDEQRRRVEKIARLTFVDAEGRQRRFLEDDELEALCIPTGTLTRQQREAIESHVTESLRFLRQIPWPAHLAQLPDIVFAHHEKLDGSGYPRGLVGHQLPPQARLLTVVDIFDAVTASDRPYRAAMPVARGLDVLREEAGEGKLDSDFVELFIDAKLWEPAGATGEYAGLTGQGVVVPVAEPGHRCEIHAEIHAER